MTPEFEFNDETTKNMPPEVRQLLLQSFKISLADFEMTMRTAFPKPYRQASRLTVQELTIAVVENIDESVRRFPCIMAQPNPARPDNWGFLFRYRADVPWYIGVFNGNYQEPTYGPHSIVQLMHTKDLMNWPQLDYLISSGMWGIQQSKEPSWNPLENFLFTISPYIRPRLIHDLEQSLRKVNFFSVGPEESLQWKLEQDDSENAWEEIRGMSRSFFHPMADPGLQEFWQKVKEDARTHLWVARSLLYPEREEGQLVTPMSLKKSVEPTILGFLLGGIHPISQDPQIHGVCVLPDERRRGIATSLIRRFFAHTGYAQAAAGVHMGPHTFQYEGAALLKKLNAEVRTKGKFVWHFNLPSPLHVQAACPST